MNPNKIQPKNKTEELLLSIAKNCETNIEQTHTKSQGILETKMTKLGETFHYNQPIQINGDWMSGLTSLEVYSSVFNITEENIKLELYIFPDSKIGGISYEKVKDEIEKNLVFSDITATGFQNEIIGPIIIKEYREKVTERVNDDKYMPILAGYVKSIFEEFEKYLRTEVDLVEDGIGLVLDEYNSSFVTYKLQPGIYTCKDLTESVYNVLQPKNVASNNVNIIEFDDITIKNKLVVRAGIIAVRFDEKSFFSSMLGFTHGWDYKHYNEYISQKIVNLNTTIKIQLKPDVINGSVKNGLI